MRVGRRDLMLAGLGLGAALAGPRDAVSREADATQPFSTYGVMPAGGAIDQTATLQDAADQAAQSGTPFFLPPGIYGTGRIDLKSGAHLQGIPGKTILQARDGTAGLISIGNARDVRLEGLVLDGGGKPLGDDGALLLATAVDRLVIANCGFAGSSEDGLSLRKASGRVTDCDIGNIRKAGLFSEDASGLEIAHNHVHDCGDNGILVWRSAQGEDGTLVTANRIERIAAKSGGSGQNGNAVNVYRAGSVLVSGNRIADCAFSAIRSNSGGNCQMIGNSCARLGEVALYAEFAFDGAIIANNLVDKAATGISVTNFNEGGRLAVVQGNLIRNLFFRKDVDTRGNGISIEADTIVSGNVIEAAAGFGILAGWMKYLRDVSITNNLVRGAHIGIGVSIDEGAGTALVTGNLITGTKDGAIRAMTGPTPTGPDLALASAEAFRNLAVYSNVAR